MIKLPLSYLNKYTRLIHRSYLNGCRYNYTASTGGGQRHYQKLLKNLYSVLEKESARLQIASAIRIFPHYLTKTYLDQFIKCQKIHQYISHLQNYSHQTHSSADQKKLVALKMKEANLTTFLYNAQNQLLLEYFIDWLLHDCKDFNLLSNNLVMELLDLSCPNRWYQFGKDFSERVFIYHHGPTNSGKTSSALKELMNLPSDKKGIYMAPLRLLAWETQKKLGHCNLITGQDKEYKNSNLTSCTIETANTSENYEVAIIDEIQMIGDPERGWAWTKALLGIQAKRIHLCGDERALELISRITETTKNKLEERRYSRLSKLTLIHQPFTIENIEPGDCVIEFSFNRLLQIRKKINLMLQQKKSNQIERNTQEKRQVKQKNMTAMVYGRFPPELRKIQATKFNNNELPYLVATNAIGMGLNLNIKKIIFVSLRRMNMLGQFEELQEHEIQQIAGRAGRGIDTTGYVQCANNNILKKVKIALQKVNQTYGLNLQEINDQALTTNNTDNNAIYLNDDKDSDKNKIEEEPQSKLKKLESTQSKHSQQQNQEPQFKFNAILNRNLNLKERSIKRAAIFIHFANVERVKYEIERLLQHRITLANTLMYILRLSKQNKTMYFLQNNVSFLKWVEELEPMKLDLEQHFNLALGLSISVARIDDPFNKMVRLGYATQYKNEKKVQLPQVVVNKSQSSFSMYEYIEDINQLSVYFSLIETYVWLWNKYELAFHEIDKAKIIKAKLVAKIEELLQKNLSKVGKKSTKKEQNTIKEKNQAYS